MAYLIGIKCGFEITKRIQMFFHDIIFLRWGLLLNCVMQMSHKFAPYLLLCISTSEWVLRTPFAGRNRLSDPKTTFSVTNGTK